MSMLEITEQLLHVNKTICQNDKDGRQTTDVAGEHVQTNTVLQVYFEDNFLLIT